MFGLPEKKWTNGLVFSDNKVYSRSVMFGLPEKKWTNGLVFSDNVRIQFRNLKKTTKKT